MALAAGATLGPYEVISLLGSGGMGEVYRARDSRLGRDVAIKILPGSVATDPDRLSRLEREARAAAALNHPNIVTVHSVEKADGLLFMTMELIEGRSLARAIPPAGMPLDQLLAIAIPLTDAVAAAHARGIIHRDLKPANVMIAAGDHGGRVKVLDFGLARLGDPSLIADAATAPTQTLTTEGRVVGTVAYMSPEQATGLPADARSDLFSLGVILYEMATGRRPFGGDSNTAVMASILKDTPSSIADLKPSLPPELGRIIKRCLVKDPARRFQSAADLRNELAELKDEVGAAASARGEDVRPTPPMRRSRWMLAGAVLLALIGFAVTYRWSSRSPASNQVPPLGERTFTRLTTLPGIEESPSLSPDGKWVVYDGNQAGNADIYLQSVTGKNAINLTKDSPSDDTEPAFSPDGERIAFRSERDGGGIFVMGRTGESVRRVTHRGFSPAWSPDGTQIAYSTAPNDPYGRSPSELWVVTLATGDERKLSGVVEGIQPSWSPHGVRIAYWTVIAEGKPMSQRDIWTVSADGTRPTAVTSDAAGDWNPVWSPDGRFIYFSSDRGGSLNLWRIPVDESSGRVLGPAEALTAPSADSRHPAISADGRTVTYASLQESTSVQKIAFDPTGATVAGRPRSVVGGSRYLSHVDVSPDGQSIAYYDRGRTIDLYIARADGTGERQLTNPQPGYDRNPRFSPDGQWIAFMSNRSGNQQIWLIKPDGSGLRQGTDAPDGALSYNPWSPDGSSIYYFNFSGPVMLFFNPHKPWNEQTPRIISALMDGNQVFDPYFWSPDGQQMFGSMGEIREEGIAVYSFTSGRFTRLSDVGFPWSVLNDGRRLLITDRQKLLVFDTGSRRSKELFSIAPDDFDSVALSRDNRTIYFTHATRQSDIWLMTMK